MCRTKTKALNLHNFPPKLRKLLNDGSVTKVGVGIAQDVMKIERSFGVKVRSAQDLSSFASGINLSTLSLADLYKAYTGETLKTAKDHRERGFRWDEVGSVIGGEGLLYAANDARAGVVIFERMVRAPDGVVGCGGVEVGEDRWVGGGEEEEEVGGAGTVVVGEKVLTKSENSRTLQLGDILKPTIKPTPAPPPRSPIPTHRRPPRRVSTTPPAIWTRALLVDALHQVRSMADHMKWPMLEESLLRVMVHSCWIDGVSTKDEAGLVEARKVLVGWREEGLVKTIVEGVVKFALVEGAGGGVEERVVGADEVVVFRNEDGADVPTFPGGAEHPTTTTVSEKWTREALCEALERVRGDVKKERWPLRRQNLVNAIVQQCGVDGVGGGDEEGSIADGAVKVLERWCAEGWVKEVVVEEVRIE
ncbi:hypothetical protein HDV00_001255, partial [Rhizophlyctis rosea]